MFKRLYMLQLRMLKAVPQHAGLNPSEFHAYTPHHNVMVDVNHHILDGDLLSRYVSLNVALQHELALSIGTTTRKILDNLIEIARFCSVH